MSTSNAGRFLEKVELGGRDFQKFSIDGKIYCIPIDEEEEERLITQHEILKLAMGDDRLYLAPLETEKMTRVLDCGYGICDWAIEMAEMHPDCHVTAVDIYPFAPADEPENLEREIHDLNRRVRLFSSEAYDFIHSRCVSPGIEKNRWPSYIRELAGLLKRGGWLQCGELYYNIQSDNGKLPDTHAISRWGVKYRQAMVEAGKEPRIMINDRLVQLMNAAGLTNVRSETLRIPIGAWGDEEQHELGEKNLDNVKDLVESHSLWPLTQKLNMGLSEFNALVEDVRTELDADHATMKLYISFTIVYGQRP